MTTGLKTCSFCGQSYSHLLVSCPKCESGDNAGRQSNPFLSGQYEGEPVAFNLPSGTKLLDERFTVNHLLGHGRWASVFLCHDCLRDIDIALKVVPLGPRNQGKASKVNHDELHLHAKLSDLSHVIHLLDVNIIPWGGINLLLLAMEFADGGSLRDWLVRNQKDVETRKREGLAFFIQACRGYQAIHQVGALHLDTKPENLLFVNGVLKVSDLGTAYLLGRGEAKANLLAEPSSLEMGTATYMSPEQFQVAHPEDLDQRSDIYGLGGILHEIVSLRARPPFGGSLERIRDCHLNVRPAQIPGIEPHLQKALDKCLAKDPEERFQSVDELINAIAQPPKPNSAQETRGERRGHVSIDEKFQEALLHFDNKDFARATRVSEEILSLRQDHLQARGLLQEVQERYRQADQIYAEASTLLEEGRMDGCFSLITEAMEVYPGHPSTGPVLTKAKMKSGRFVECMASATEALQNAAWDNAASLFEEALQLNRQVPNVVEVLNRINRIRQAISGMHTALSQSDFPRAGQLAGLADSLTEDLMASLPGLGE